MRTPCRLHVEKLPGVPQNDITGPILEEALACASDKWWDYLMGGRDE
jgi:hypothetical protein